MSLENGITSIKEEINEDYLSEIVSSNNTVEAEDDCEKDERETKVDNPGIIYCEMCADAFTTQYDIMAHMQIHLEELSSDDPQYTCPQCKKSFSERSSLNFHRSIHIVKKQHVCGKCGRSFAHIGYLRQHFEAHDAKKKTVACPECGKSYARESYLRKHRKVHETKKSTFACLKCGECLNAMLTRAHKCKTIRCKICGDLFASSNGLHHHMKIHNKPCVCGKCGKSFSSLLHLQSHERSHSGLANLDNCCFRCGAYFEKFEDLGKHLKNHETNTFQHNVKLN